VAHNYTSHFTVTAKVRKEMAEKISFQTIAENFAESI